MDLLVKKAHSICAASGNFENYQHILVIFPFLFYWFLLFARLIEALTRAGKSDHSRLEDARRLFEEMLTYANHVGLYAEETGFGGEALGNFPQGESEDDNK